MAQLSSQFVAVVIESAFARTLSGKISPVTTHAMGPYILGISMLGILWLYRHEQVGGSSHPSRSEEKDIDAHKSDRRLLRCQIGGVYSSCLGVLTCACCS